MILEDSEASNLDCYQLKYSTLKLNNFITVCMSQGLILSRGLLITNSNMV
jgi:hypothetical protein